MQTPIPIDLAAPRSIVIRQAGRAYTFHIRPITEQDWFAYFDSIVTTSERKGNDVVRRSDAGAAGVTLVEKVLTGAEGYRLPPGQTSLTGLDGWESKIPMQHRLAIAEVLLNVSAIELGESDDALLIGSEAVALEALWSADEQGNIRKHAPLVHVFDTPSADHQRKYLRDASRSRIVGGSRQGRTVWQGAQRTLAALYDELIQDVQGYVWGSSSLACADRTEIARRMDTRHKVAAAEKLFAPAVAEDENGESGE